MLQEFVEMLQTITDCRAEASYNRRLYQLSLIVTDVVKARRTQHKRPKPTSEGPTDPYLMSELLSPATTGYSYMNSEVQETYDSRFDGGVFQDPDGSFAPMSSITSTSGELARGSDEFLSQLRSYGKSAPGTNTSILWLWKPWASLSSFGRASTKGPVRTARRSGAIWGKD